MKTQEQTLNKLSLLLIPLLIAGCTISTQRFINITYDENGNMISEVRAKSRTYVPPFRGSKTQDEHKLFVVEEENGWAIEMESARDITGGEVSATIEAVTEGLKPSLIP